MNDEGKHEAERAGEARTGAPWTAASERAVTDKGWADVQGSGTETDAAPSSQSPTKSSASTASAVPTQETTERVITKALVELLPWMKGDYSKDHIVRTILRELLRAANKEKEGE
jgi:hypothetical protein